MMPRPMAEKGVDLFLDALQMDLFPSEDMERLFGVQGPRSNDPDSMYMKIDSPFGSSRMHIGQAVYGAWTTLRNYGLLHREALVEALMDGRMDEFFTWLLQQSMTSDGGKSSDLSYYLQAMHNGGLAKIPWEILPTAPAVKSKRPFYLPRNTVVVLEGLSSEQGRQLNGKKGKMVGRDEDRYHVKLEGSEELKRLQPKNVFQVIQTPHHSAL